MAAAYGTVLGCKQFPVDFSLHPDTLHIYWSIRFMD